MNKDTKVSWSVVTGFLGLTLLGVSLSLNGCAAADSREATSGPTPKAQMTNSELEEKIKARFKTDAQLNAANLSVDANVNRNEITLSGTVGIAADQSDRIGEERACRFDRYHQN